MTEIFLEDMTFELSLKSMQDFKKHLGTAYSAEYLSAKHIWGNGG